jgi:hypothetical protein
VSFFLNGAEASKDTVNASLCRLHITDRPLGNLEITNTPCKSAKGTSDLVKKRDPVLMLSTKHPTESLRSGHHTTVGQQGHLGRGDDREARAAIEAAGAGALHPFGPNGETERIVAGRRREDP